MMGDCIASDVMRFYFGFSVTGFFVGLSVYLFILLISRYGSWIKSECEIVEGGYVYSIDGRQYKSKNYSISTEIPFSKSYDFSEKKGLKLPCYIRKGRLAEARIVNKFHTLRDAAIIMGSIIIAPVMSYYFAKWCGYLDRTAEVIGLPLLGMMMAALIIAVHRSGLTSKISK